MKKTENPKKKKGGKLTLVIIVTALAVMAFALFKIAQIYKDYQESEQTFEKLEETYVVNPDGSSVAEDDWNDDTRIQFDALKKKIRILWHGYGLTILMMYISAIRYCIPGTIPNI